MGLPAPKLDAFFCRIKPEEVSSGQGAVERERPKVTGQAQNADIRRFTPAPGNSSIWRAQETTENHRFSQKTKDFCSKGSVTLGPSQKVRRFPSLWARFEKDGNKRLPRSALGPSKDLIFPLRSLNLSEPSQLLSLDLQGASMRWLLGRRSSISV